MKTRYLVIFLLVVSAGLPIGLSAKNSPGNAADKAQGALKSNPPVETPSGTTPAEPGNPGKPGAPSKPETPSEPSKPADSLKNSTPPEETPSGTKPADPAKPGENPANHAEPGDKANADKDKGVDDKNKPDTADKDAKGKKDKIDKPGKGGKGEPSLSSGAPTPPGGAPLAPAAGAIGGGILGGILSGGKEKAEKKEIPLPAAKKAAKEAAVSTETVKEAEPVQNSTQAAAAEPLYSAGLGPKIAVMDFDGELGAEFSAQLSKALSADLKVYNSREPGAKEYDPAAITRVSAKKIASEIDVEYIITGKVGKKSETLSIISVFLRDGKTGDIKMTDNHTLRSAGELEAAAASAARKIKEICR